MFKPGDRVICIDISDSDNLTYKKVYTVLDVICDYKDYVDILDDNGNQNTFYKKRFISLKDYRKQKLNKICLSQEIE